MSILDDLAAPGYQGPSSARRSERKKRKDPYAAYLESLSKPENRTIGASIARRTPVGGTRADGSILSSEDVQQMMERNRVGGRGLDLLGEQDPEEKSEGLLSKAAGILGMGEKFVAGTGAALYNTLSRPILEGLGVETEAIDIDGRDNEADGGSDNVLDAWHSAFIDRDAENDFGFGKLPGLLVEDSDSLAGEGAKRGLAAALSIGTDPTTYLTGGAGILGRKAVTEATELGVKAAARNVLAAGGDDAARLTARFGNEAGASAFQKEAAERGLTDIAERSGDELADQVADRIAQRAAQARTKGGSIGMRRELQDVFGERFDDVWRALPGDTRGGLRLRAPGWVPGKVKYADDAAGGAKVYKTKGLTEGGGLTLERLGKPGTTVADWVEGSTRLRNKAAASGPLAYFGARSGETGKEWVGYIRSVADDTANPDGYAYKAYAITRDGYRQVRSDTHKTAEHLAELEGATKALIDGYGEPGHARVLDFYHNAELRNARLGPDAPDLDLAAQRAAQELHKSEDLAFGRAAKLDPNREYLDDERRHLTDEAAEQLNLMRADEDAFRQSSSGKAARTGRGDRMVLSDDLAELTVEWTDTRDINKRFRELKGVDYDLFVEDPWEITRRTVAGLDRQTTANSITKLFEDAGLLVSTEAVTKPRLRTKAAGDIGVAARNEIVDEADQLQAEADRLLADAADEVGADRVAEARTHSEMLKAARAEEKAAFADVDKFTKWQAEAVAQRDVARKAVRDAEKAAKAWAKEVLDNGGDLPPDLASRLKMGTGTRNASPRGGPLHRKALLRADGAYTKAAQTASSLGEVIRHRADDAVSAGDDIAELGEDLADFAARTPGAAGNVEAVERLGERLTPILADTEKLGELLEHIHRLPAGAEQMAAVEALIEGVKAARFGRASRLAKQFGEDSDQVLEARAGYEEMLETWAREGKDLAKELPKPAMEMLATPGVGRVGREANNPKLKVAAPTRAENALATTPVVQMMNRMFDATDPKEASSIVKNFFDPYTSVWKFYATVMRGPGFVSRNVSSGMWMGYLVGAQAKHWKVAAKYSREVWKAEKRVGELLNEGKVTASNAGELLDRVLEKRLSSIDVGDGTLYDVHLGLRNSGVLEGNVNLATMTKDADPAGLVARDARFGRRRDLWDHLDRDEMGTVAKRATQFGNWTVNHRAAQAAGRFSQGSETFLRAGTYISQADRYGTDETGLGLAALYTRATQFDYGDLSDAERQIMKRFLPFIVFAKNNIPVAIRSVFYEPGKVNRVLELHEATKDALETEDSELAGLAPSWVKSTMGFVTGADLPGVGLTPSTGGPMTMGINLPLMAAEDFVRIPNDVSMDSFADTALGAVTGGVTEEGMNQMHPLAKLVIEGSTKENLFTGSAYKEDGREAPWWYDALPDALPFSDTWEDKAEDQTKGDDFTISQMRSLVPGLATIDRILPETEGEGDRYITSMLSMSGASGVLPIAPMSTLTEGQVIGEQSAQADRKETALRRAAAERGIDYQRFREVLRKHYTDEQISEMLESGALNLPGL